MNEILLFLTYGRAVLNVRDTIKKMEILLMNSVFDWVFQKQLLIAFRRNKYLQDILRQKRMNEK